MKKTLAAIGTVLSMASGAALAQGPDLGDFYVGGGFSNNELSHFDDATGFQFFGGYNLDSLLNLGVENLSRQLKLATWTQESLNTKIVITLAT